MIVFENEFSAIIRQTQTIYDCNRLPSLCSNLLRPFDPLKDFSGRGQYLATTKDEISHEETRSKIGHHRVLKTLVEQLLRGFLLFKTSKMVTFGHHFEKGGPKNAPKAV